MKAESRCVRYSEDCPEGQFFEKGEEIPDGFYRRKPDKPKASVKKTVKKRKYTKKSDFWDKK